MAQTEEEKISELIQTAAKAKESAYCPYSNFQVGAAVLCTDGTIFSGCNVENCSYGLSICAERTALVKAVSEGYRKFKAVAVASNLKGEISPCGPCRQFIVEFGSDLDVYMTSSDLSYKKFKISELLPLGFKPSDLDNVPS